MARFEGRRRLAARIARIQQATREEVRQALRQGALLIEGTAKASIQEQTPSGVFYPSRGRKGAMHEASPPGSPPNADTGELHTSITSAMRETPTSIEIETGANTPYATHLELGTSRMAPRPYMRPAFNRHKDDAERLIRAAVRRAAQRGARR